MAKTFQFDDFSNPQHPNCAACEELLTDAIDGLLSPADQAFFNLHLTSCSTCTEKYAQAQRGAAWLDVLKSHRPEPSSHLLERILAQTTGDAALASETIFDHTPLSIPARPVNVLPFIPRPVSRFTRYTRLAMEPRLAMTAAMAFFSIALTLNLTGVRLDQIHAADLKPASLKRTYYEANASAVRYYDNLRVVRVLESRVDDIRQSNEDDRPSHASPESTPDLPPQTRPDQPNQQQQPKQQPAKPEGSSRRESPLPRPTMLQAGFNLTLNPVRHDPAPGAAVAHNLKKEGGLV